VSGKREARGENGRVYLKEDAWRRCKFGRYEGVVAQNVVGQNSQNLIYGAVCEKKL
jgi:hypothetical protein